MITRVPFGVSGASSFPGVLFFCLFLVSSCTLERRGEESAERDSTTVGPVNESEFAEELARQSVRLFRDAVFAGDISRALSLMEDGASLIDPLAGKSSAHFPVGEVLLELRRRHADGVRFEMIEDEVTLLPSGEALVITTLSMLQEEEGVGQEVGRIYESALLFPSPEGWKVRHLHRSLADLPQR
jgi:hypothetical protein